MAQSVESAERGSATVTSAYAIVTCLFFAWGFITSLVDPLVAAAADAGPVTLVLEGTTLANPVKTTGKARVVRR